MADFTFNIALGKTMHYASLPAANDALILVVLKASGLQADDTLRDHDDLAALLAASNDECDFTGYARRTLAASAPVIDDTNNRTDVDATDPTAYTNTGGSSQAAGKAIICYDPDTTTGTDSTLVPLWGYDCVVTFDIGVAVSVAFHANGLGRAA
jgi:hypothetical protein